MKKFMIFSFLLLGLAITGLAQTTTPPIQQDPKTMPEVQFVTESHDFGTVKEGTLATWEFKFKNTGKSPLLISNVAASCGCTTPQWTKEPIKPGEMGTVTAVYNSNGRPGQFQKTITVYSNAITNTKVLTISGNVESPQQIQQSPVVNPNPQK